MLGDIPPPCLRLLGGEQGPQIHEKVALTLFYFVIGSCRVIRDEGGEITAFDGDRVMALFIGTLKNSSAAKAALRINYIVREINNLIKEHYPKTTYSLRHCVGIDTSSLFVARTGIRNTQFSSFEVIAVCLTC